MYKLKAHDCTRREKDPLLAFPVMVCKTVLSGKLAAALQAQAQSQVQGGPLAGRGGPGAFNSIPSQQDTIETWRRHIYVQGLRAVPMGEHQTCLVTP
jgi:uncharacterized Zn-binding protein involved in type VI secretion